MKNFEELILPKELRYAKDHEWVLPTAPHRIGVSDFAQDQLGDITFAELPAVGKTVAVGEEFGSLESIKSVSSLFSPVSGTSVAVNGALEDDPGLVNREPYAGGWLVEVELANPADLDNLMDGETYQSHVKESL